MGLSFEMEFLHSDTLFERKRRSGVAEVIEDFKSQWLTMLSI